MNTLLKIRNPQSAIRNSGGFTLIELLTVIAIIALLAGLIVGGAHVANKEKARSRVLTERNALESAIERYKKAKGFYPPDGADPAGIQTPLFYELTGTTIIGNPPTGFQSMITGENIATNMVNTLFNSSGFINSSGDPASPAQNFYDGLKNAQHLVVSGNGGTYTVMGVPVSGPVQLQTAAPGSAIPYINPWHYNSSHPTNNQNSYDLWMDVQYGGKTNRISNWSADPQVVAY